MKLTKEEFETLKLYVQLTHQEDKYVFLRQDEKGTYIEYAFKEGAPHDNRCLSWYYSLQPNAMKRNHDGDSPEDIQKIIDLRRKSIESNVDHIFTLHAFSCGHEEDMDGSLKENEASWKEYHPCEPFIKEDHMCRVGCPAPKCIKNKICAHWTYEEPVKCACWNLSAVNELPKCVSISMDKAVELKDHLIR